MAFVSSRQSFGHPIVDNQGVSFPLAELETYVEAARLLCYQTLAAKDGDLPHTHEAAMRKWWAPKLAFDVVQQCLLLHRHTGYSRDLPFEQRLRDVLGLQIGDETEQSMNHFIAREVLRAICHSHGFGRKARHVIVTGDGGGIGSPTARPFAGLGAKVAVLDRDNEVAEKVAA